MSESSIEDQLDRIGIRRGDHVLVRVAGREMTGYPEAARQESATDGLLHEVLRAVGPTGTVLGLAFTRSERLVATPGDGRVFTTTSEPTTGKFVRSMLSHAGAVRSQHPTNSFVAIGGSASRILAGHTPRSHPFRPVEDLVLMRGKLLLVGCTRVSPGFSTVHLAQYQLGLSNRTLMTGLALGRYRDEYGRLRTARKWDVPGCSMGFGRMYPMYRERGLLSESEVWGAESMLIDAASALSVERETLLGDPTAVLCQSPECISCRASLLYNRRNWLPFWRRKAGRALSGVLRRSERDEIVQGSEAQPADSGQGIARKISLDSPVS